MIYWKNGEIKEAIIESDRVKFKQVNEDDIFYTDNPKYDGFKEKLLLNDVLVTEKNTADNIFFLIDTLLIVIFIGMIIGAIVKFIRTTNSNFKLVRHTKVKLNDIVGMDELKKEVMTHVEILKNPKVYLENGIRQTKGIILEGPPGNRKNFICKSNCRRSKCKFYCI